MNNSILKVCPLCGSRSQLLHNIENIIDNTYCIHSYVSCINDHCGIKLSRKNPIPKDQIPKGIHSSTKDLECLSSLKLIELKLLGEWNMRSKNPHLTNKMLG